MLVKLNVGSAVNGVDKVIDFAMLTDALGYRGFQWSKIVGKQSGTEYTYIVVAETDFDTQFELGTVVAALSADLGQDAIAWRSSDWRYAGVDGPKAGAWGKFTPEFFLE